MPEEKCTPSPWKAERLSIVHAEDAIVDVASGEWIAAVSDATSRNARLLAEAPLMFALIKQGLAIDKNNERQCPCALCAAGRAIVARVEGYDATE